MSLKESTNKFVVEGILKSKNIRKTKSKKGTDIILGSVTIEVKTGDKVNNHNIQIFATAKTKKGTDNPMYKGYETVLNTYKDKDTYGDEADLVSAKGSLDYNIYKSKADQSVKTNTRLKGTFINRVKDTQDFKHKAKANVEMVVNTYKEEIKKDEPTGYVLVDAYSVGYNDRIIKVDNLKYNASQFELSDYVDEGDTFIATIELHNYIILKKEPKASTSFGAFEEVVKSFSYERRNEIVGGDISKNTYSEDDLKLIKSKLREQITEVEAQEVSQPKKETVKSGSGFGKQIDISDDDIPF